MRKCGWEDGVGLVDLENALEHWKEFLVSVSDLRMFFICGDTLENYKERRKKKM